MSGITRWQARIRARDERDHDEDAHAESAKPARMRLRGGASRPPAREQRDEEHRQRERRERDAGLQRVVSEVELEVDGQCDEEAAEGDVLQDALADPEAEELGLEEVGVEERGLALALAAAEPPDERNESRSRDEEGADRLAALLPHQYPEHQQGHRQGGPERPDEVDAPVAGEGHLADQPAAQQHAGDDHRLEQEADSPRKEGGQGAADEGADRRGDGARRADHREDLGLHLPLEVAVDQRLHRGQIERGAKAPDHRPEDDDGGEALREHHRDGAQGIEDEAGHIGPFAAEEVAQLAADQDEGGRDERLEGDRRLDPADGRVEILDHRRDRDVHERRVDDEDEHRHRQEDAQPRVPFSDDIAASIARRDLSVTYPRRSCLRSDSSNERKDHADDQDQRSPSREPPAGSDRTSSRSSSSAGTR